MVSEIPEDVQRWTANRRATLVLSILRGETSAQEAARKHDLRSASYSRPRARCARGPKMRKR